MGQPLSADDVNLLESVFHATPDGISVLDPELNIVWVNSTIKQWYPQSGPMQGCKCYRIYHIRNHPCHNCPTIRAMQSRQLAMEVVALPNPQQGIEWRELYAFPLLDQKGRLNGAVEYVRNISERMAIEQALRYSEQRYRMIADFTYDWEYWIAPDKNYVYVSPSCERVTGYPASKFLENADFLQTLVHQDDLKEVEDHFSTCLTSHDVASLEFRILARDGRQHWISHICQPVYGDDGRHLGRRGSNRDLTQYKQMEAALRDAHQDLENRVKDRTLQLQIAAKALKAREADLLNYKGELERVNQELFETNRAVTVLARNIDKNRRDVESKFAKTMSSRIMPLVEDLKKAKSFDSVRVGLDYIAANVQNLSSDLSGKMNLLASLTPTELRVATMIKKGLTSQEIAKTLHVSLHTIKSHRRNIRKKMNIQNSAINLESYLRSIMW